MPQLQLREFVALVKAELRDATEGAADGQPLRVQEVELEVSFTLDATGGAKARLFVVDLETSGKTSRTHRVKLKLTPVVNPPLTETGKIDLGILQYSGVHLDRVDNEGRQEPLDQPSTGVSSTWRPSSEL